MAVWRGITISFLAGGIGFLFLAGLMGTRTQDVWIHDKYLVILPGHIRFVAIVLVVAAVIVWKLKVAR
jgi:hypothetical protein